MLNAALVKSVAEYFILQWARAIFIQRPPPDVSLFESDLRGIILTDKAFLQSGLARFSRIHIEKLPVVDTPKDSFGNLTSDPGM